MQVKGPVPQVFVAEKAGTWVESPVVGEVVNLDWRMYRRSRGLGRRPLRVRSREE